MNEDELCFCPYAKMICYKGYRVETNPSGKWMYINRRNLMTETPNEPQCRFWLNKQYNQRCKFD